MSKTRRDKYRHIWLKMDYRDLTFEQERTAFGHGSYGDSNRNKFYKDWSNKKLRTNTKRLIEKERFDDIVSKPENVDWIID